MSDVKVNLQGTKLDWHSIEETPPLHTVEYAGNISLWAIVEPPNQNPGRDERDFVAKTISGQESPG
jgi:hypothetical protein